MTVTKEKIASMLVSQLGFSNGICEEIVNAFFFNILEISKKQKVTLRNFGSFEIKQKNPRPGTNFHTKTPVTIESKKVLRFVPSAKLKTLVNKNEVL